MQLASSSLAARSVANAYYSAWYSYEAGTTSNHRIGLTFPRSSYPGTEAIPPNSSTRIREALERIVGLYSTWHGAELGKGYDAKADERVTKLDQCKTVLP